MDVFGKQLEDKRTSCKHEEHNVNLWASVPTQKVHKVSIGLVTLRSNAPKLCFHVVDHGIFIFGSPNLIGVSWSINEAYISLQDTVTKALPPS